MKIEDGMAGELFHTGLRKAIDSNWSVVAWNLVYKMTEDEHGQEVWQRFCGWLTGQVREFNGTEETFEDVFDAWDEAGDQMCSGLLTNSRRGDSNDLLARSSWWNIWRKLIAIMPEEDARSLYHWFRACCEEGG